MQRGQISATESFTFDTLPLARGHQTKSFSEYYGEGEPSYADRESSYLEEEKRYDSYDQRRGPEKSRYQERESDVYEQRQSDVYDERYQSSQYRQSDYAGQSELYSYYDEGNGYDNENYQETYANDYNPYDHYATKTSPNIQYYNKYDQSPPTPPQKDGFMMPPPIAYQQTKPAPIPYRPPAAKSTPYQPPKAMTSSMNKMEDKGGDSDLQFRACCGFFPRRTFFRIVLPMIIFLFLGIGLTIFFVFPRAPIVSASPLIDFSQINMGTVGDINNGNFSAKLDLVTNITLTSPNYIAWKTSSITGSAYLISSDGSNNLISGVFLSGFVKQPIPLKARGLAMFGMLLSMNYRLGGPITKKTELADKSPFLFHLAMSCNPKGIGYSPYPNHQADTVSIKLDTRLIAEPWSFYTSEPESIIVTFKCTSALQKLVTLLSTLE